MTNELHIAKGKFYKGNIEQPIEFGNTEQIKCYRCYCDRYNLLKEGIEAYADWDSDEEEEEEEYGTATVSFKCVCSRIVKHEIRDTAFESYAEEFNGVSVTCWSCKRDYEFEITPHHEAIIIKLID